MDWNLFILFVVLNIVNVIIQTVKSLATVKCGKWSASIINAITYGFYTIVTIYMLCDLSLWIKATVVAVCNLVGVFVVKLAEEKMRKDKLWKVEMTVKGDISKSALISHFKKLDIPFNYIATTKDYTIFNIFCATQKESALVKDLAIKYNTKFFVSESKNL